MLHEVLDPFLLRVSTDLLIQFGLEAVEREKAIRRLFFENSAHSTLCLPGSFTKGQRG
jgi:hypothetical protein